MLGIGAVLLAIEGTWSVDIHATAWFAAYLLLLMTALSQAILSGLERKAKTGFILNHLSLLIIVWASLFGSVDVSKTKILLSKGETTQIALTDDKMVVHLPFAITLNDFRVDYYDDGVSPKQYTSLLTIDNTPISTSVNHPCSVDGYTIFQYGYDQMEGQYTILQLVRDPWLPIVYAGMALLALGSLLLLFGKWKMGIVLPVTLVLTILFTVLTIEKISFGTLMPALRSWWFVPHLFIYMVAYSMMALALTIWLAERYGKVKIIKGMSDGLARSSAALIIIGMLCGSVWAREAWGDYWAWDPKECWAAVTWLIILMHLHLNGKRGWKALVILIIAFLALQITWYGVNYLPSAQDSMHAYT